jgi:hypothetical protein
MTNHDRNEIGCAATADHLVRMAFAELLDQPVGDPDAALAAASDAFCSTEARMRFLADTSLRVACHAAAVMICAGGATATDPHDWLPRPPRAPLTDR